MLFVTTYFLTFVEENWVPTLQLQVADETIDIDRIISTASALLLEASFNIVDILRRQKS